MKNITYLLFTLLFSLILITSCFKKEDKSSETKDVKKDKPAFTTGFYCEMDGKEWFLPDSVSYMSSSSKDFRIYALKGDYNEGPYEDFFFFINTKLITSEFPLAAEGNPSHVQFNSNLTLKEKKSKDDYDAFWSKSGKLVVTKFDDTHAEGTFDFTASTSDDPPKTIKFTNGKFNLKIK